MSKPKFLSIFEPITSGKAHSKLNNIVPDVTKSGTTLVVPDSISISGATMLTFKVPCSCSDVTGISVENTTYTLVDATNQNIPTTGSFDKDATVSILLDPSTSYAYLQNSAATSHANTASSLKNKRRILLTGAVTGAALFDGSTDIQMHTVLASVSRNIVNRSGNYTQDTTEEVPNGFVHINSVHGGEVQSTHRIVGLGATKVEADTDGTIMVSSDTGITYGTKDLEEGVSELKSGTLYFVIPADESN